MCREVFDSLPQAAGGARNPFCKALIDGLWHMVEAQGSPKPIEVLVYASED